MACDPSELVELSKCILACLTKGQMDAVNSKLFCDMASTSGNFVKKAGDTMTGSLLMTNGNSFNSGLAISSAITAKTGVYAAYFASSNTTQVLCRYSNDASGPSINSFKTRRTTDSSADATVLLADLFFNFSIWGADGVNYVNAAQMESFVSAAPGVANMPGGIRFYTTLDGSAVATLRWTINDAALFSGTPAFKSTSGTTIPAGGTDGVGYMFSSTANFGVFYGSNIPSLSAAQGSLYLRSDGSSATTRAYINTTGAAVWTAITTVA